MYIYEPSTMTLHEGNTVPEMIDKLKSLYNEGEVVLGELFTSIHLVGVSIEEVINIAKILRRDIDGIEDSVDYKE